MAVFQLYKLLFNRSREGNMFATMDNETAYNKAQELLEDMLTGALPITKEKRDKSVVKLENYIEKKRDGITIMVVCNEKNHRYKEKMTEQELVYHPGCRVIIDNRRGVAQIAIEKSQSFDGKTDTVRDKVEEALNKLFDKHQLTVEIRAKRRPGTFWEAVEEQTRMDDRIESVTYEFPDTDEIGPVDVPPSAVEILSLFKQMNDMMNAPRGTYTWFSSKEKAVKLDRTREDLCALVGMCCQNGYNIKVQFKHLGYYRFGDKILAISNLNDETLNNFINGQTTIGKDVSASWELIQWLDHIKKATEDYADDEPIKKRRKRYYKQSLSGESDISYAAESL